MEVDAAPALSAAGSGPLSARRRESAPTALPCGAKYETGASYAHVAFAELTVGAWVENTDYAVAFIADERPGSVLTPVAVGSRVDPFDRLP